MESFLRILDNLAFPLGVVSAMSFLGCFIYFCARHEENEQFMSEKYAYERSRSPGFIKLMIFLAIVFCLSLGINGIAEPYERVVEKQKIVYVDKIKTKVVYKDYKMVPPNLVTKFDKCVSARKNEGYRDFREVMSMCRQYVNNLKAITVLDKSKNIIVYYKLPYGKFMDRCKEELRHSDQSTEADVKLCNKLAGEHLRGLVRGVK